MEHLRIASLGLLAILLLPTVLAEIDSRAENGDFEIAGDDPTDVPFWDLPSRVGVGGRVDNVGRARDAALVLNGGAFATTADPFPVTSGEPLVFTTDARVVAGRARILLEFTNIGGALVGSRQHDLVSGPDWVVVTGPTIVVPAGALYGRVTLESFAPDLASGVGSPRQSALALFDNVVVRSPAAP